MKELDAKGRFFQRAICDKSDLFSREGSLRAMEYATARLKTGNEQIHY